MQELLQQGAIHTSQFLHKLCPLLGYGIACLGDLQENSVAKAAQPVERPLQQGFQATTTGAYNKRTIRLCTGTRPLGLLALARTGLQRVLQEAAKVIYSTRAASLPSASTQQQL